MIVKNESHCVTRALDSVKDIIDHYIIFDTGSTDNTLDILYKYTSTLNISGNVEECTWVDFSYNRNKALKAAQQTGCDYVLILDADDMFFCDKSTLQNLDGKSNYLVEMRHGNLTFPQIHLVHKNDPCYYEGVTHEVLISNAPVKHLENAYMQLGSDGYRRSNNIKTEDDIRLLQESVKNKPSAREVFYLAQAYRDNNDLENSLKYYTQRTLMGGYSGEIYNSYIEIGGLYNRLQKDYDTIKDAYIKAHQINPNRCEAYCWLAQIANNFRKHEEAYYYASLACQIKKPAKEQNELFVFDSCYDWNSKYQLSIAAFHCNKFKECIELCDDLLKCIPEYYKESVSINKSLSLAKLTTEFTITIKYKDRSFINLDVIKDLLKDGIISIEVDKQ
jgi:glycosyltransferase involved in cell wall biosynthesis